MHQLPDIENTDSKEEIYCLKWTIDNGRRKESGSLMTDTDQLNNIVHCYRISLYNKEVEVDLKLTEYQSLLTKQVYLLSYLDTFYKR